MNSLLLILLNIFTYPTYASVVMLNQCQVTASIIDVDPQKGFEWLKIKTKNVAKKGSTEAPCDFVKNKHVYISLVKEKYVGKYLRVPPLKPGMLKVGATFKAKVHHSDGSRQMHWVLMKNDLGIPAETSFLTNYDPKN